jgi:hypothetical protein
LYIIADGAKTEIDFMGGSGKSEVTADPAARVVGWIEVAL